jgi:hypothetical protein
MKNLMKRFENIFAASAFAEAGEFETAKQIMEEVRPEKRVRAGRLERIMMAITFAEAGEHETAIDIMREEKRPQKRERITPRPRIQLRAPGIKR